jgi:threonine aldolase
MGEKAVVDLRSDTVTRPSAEMRAAMAAADVGDDVYGEDPTVNRLQERAAAVFRREAALFVPSGTMGNQIAIRLHTRPGQEIITEQRSHIFNYEMAAPAALSGVFARPVPAPHGILSWELIEPVIAPRIYYRAQTGMIALENSHNMAGGTVYSAQEIAAICARAHERNLPVHLDGARIFNAAVALCTDVASLTAPCDSVMFCLSKGLGAPVGSMLVGTRAFIEEARGVRKLLGGGMRQVGVLAAAGLIALEKMPHRLADDHANARRLAVLLGEVPSLDVDPLAVRTNIVAVGIQRTGLDSGRFTALLRDSGVMAGVVDTHTIRLLTHLDVNRSQIERAAGIIRDIAVLEGAPVR